jgi:hypothetical protein
MSEESGYSCGQSCGGSGGAKKTKTSSEKTACSMNTSFGAPRGLKIRSFPPTGGTIEWSAYLLDNSTCVPLYTIGRIYPNIEPTDYSPYDPSGNKKERNEAIVRQYA